ncbi:hypothetical protein ACFSTE_19650 [Aquimarina hainanensis]|uniref:Uncharacterized protein n=1 Tax=Aquimarina hainanensis TaxID=1578017 RepID=A0ABW5NBZ3_9FLAO
MVCNLTKISDPGRCISGLGIAIEFKPSDISFIEWNKPNGDREKKYGYR